MANIIDKISFLENIEYFSRLISQTLNLPIFCCDQNAVSLFRFSEDFKHNPFIEVDENYYPSLFRDVSISPAPIFKTTSYYENYFSIPLIYDEAYIGRLVVGPSIYSDMSKVFVDSVILEQKLPYTHKSKLVEYYNSLTVLSYRRLISAATLLYSNIYENHLTLSDILKLDNNDNDVPSDNYRKSLSYNRVNSFIHHSKEGESKLWQSIREGNLDNFKRLISTPNDGEFGILSKNSPIRAEKNLAICGIAIATRAAMDGGLDSEEAYTLSDYYIQEIEASIDINHINLVKSKGFYDFVIRVNSLKNSKFKKVIQTSLTYIDTHLYEKLNTSTLANNVKLNANYFSEVFKKELGVTPSEYITKKRVDEAKYLLSTTGYTISEISVLLDFNDQSHFTKVFKKLTGLTPKKFKSNAF